MASLSPTGGLCRGLPALDPGNSLIVELPEYGAVEATVIRQDGDDLGIAFQMDENDRQRLADHLGVQRLAA